MVFTGAPGTGKTYYVEEIVKEPMEKLGFKKKEYFVQFHSSYDYTDFMEGLRPVKNEKGKMKFVRMDGIFKAFCRRVVEQKKPEETHCFVIDEINRADLGRVFGELMYCFEKRYCLEMPDKDHRIATQYTNLPACGEDGNEIKPDCFENGFYIPGNVVIIGTMNDIDRSVETFDFALRRRFDWVEIEADKVMASSFAEMGVPTDIVDQIKEINGVIAAKSGLGPEFKIGPAYFKDYSGKNIDNIWERNIKPILREYMRGRQGAEGFVEECEEALKTPLAGK